MSPVSRHLQCGLTLYSKCKKHNTNSELGPGTLDRCTIIIIIIIVKLKLDFHYFFWGFHFWCKTFCNVPRVKTAKKLWKTVLIDNNNNSNNENNTTSIPCPLFQFWIRVTFFHLLYIVIRVFPRFLYFRSPWELPSVVLESPWTNFESPMWKCIVSGVKTEGNRELS